MKKKIEKAIEKMEQKRNSAFEGGDSDIFNIIPKTWQQAIDILKEVLKEEGNENEKG